MTQQDLESLVAHQAIAQSIYRYCRGMDRIDNDLANSAFWPGAQVQYGSDIYGGSATGFVEMVADVHRGMITTHHQVGNMLIELEGNGARSETYITVTFHLRREDGSLEQRLGIGRYLDTWECRRGEWKIADRVYVHSIDEGHLVAENSYARTSSRDRGDISYSYFK